MSSGYWQVEMQEDSKKLTAFATRSGLFEWNRMPFGLKCSPATYCRLMHMVLNGLTYIDCLVYLDDVLIFSGNPKDDLAEELDVHLCKLYKVFRRLRQHKLTVNPSKTFLFQRKTKYLGHVIDSTGIAPDPALVNAVEDYPIPATKKQVRRLLGLSGYYRDHIRDFSTITHPLSQLCSLKSTWTWNEEHQFAFEYLKHLLTSAPILAHPDFSKTFYLLTDACCKGISAILTQYDDQGNEHPITFISRSTRGKEQDYNTRRLEALAIYWAVKKHRRFLEGQRFKVVSDHNPLTYMRKEKNDRQICRWITELEWFTFDIVYRKGSEHQAADSLNRVYEDITESMPQEGQEPSTDSEPHIFDAKLEINALTQIQDLMHSEKDLIKQEQRTDSDFQDIIPYLEDFILPEDGTKAQNIKRQANAMHLHNGLLVRKSSTETSI
jgi:RNase H-like domain found in reverse transcriptase/Reverse transcriptase (RNA-dependent DNA polymerase)